MNIRILNRSLVIVVTMALSFTTFASEQKDSEETTIESTPSSLKEWRSWEYGMFIHYGMATYVEGRDDENDPRNAKEPSTLYAPTDLDVDQWIRVARDAGMKYAVLTAKHSAGHCLWDSKVQFRGKEFDYDIATSGNKTDVVAEFMKACKKYKVAPGLYWCLLDWRNNSVKGKGQWRQGDLPDDYFQFAKDQLVELLTNYPETEYLWLDIPRAASMEERTELYHHIKKINPACLVLMNFGLKKSAAVSIANYQDVWPTDILNTERHPLKSGQFESRQSWKGKEYELGYEHCDTICKKWFWVEGDKPRPPQDLYELYRQTTTAEGNLLLNVPPAPSGRIPDYHVQSLMEIKKMIDADKTAQSKIEKEVRKTERDRAILEGIAGPLVGAIEPDRVNVWMFAPAESQCSYTYQSVDSAQSDGGKGQLVAVPEPAADGPGRPFKTVIKGLSPDIRYRYNITVDGKSDPAWVGTFKTAPAVGNPAAFRLALTSCMRIGPPQSSWLLLLAQQPDLHLVVGDSHYADTTDPTVQLKHHVTYRRQPEFATVICNIPTYAIWDDHDYGPNDSDGTAMGKEHSLASWKQVWANPALGTPDTPGAFFKFSHGDVDFFMVDSRYHRSPNEAPDDDQKRMLGDAQFAWLLDGLKNSQARFKVIVSGSTLDHSKVDGWRIYTFSRHRLFDAINEHEISGVMYMSGDIHRSLVWEHPESDRVGYPLVEVISSGVAASKTRSFATVDFDTTCQDPTARVRIVYGDGTVRTDKTWKLSQLGPKHQTQ